MVLCKLYKIYIYKVMQNLSWADIDDEYFDINEVKEAEPINDEPYKYPNTMVKGLWGDESQYLKPVAIGIWKHCGNWGNNSTWYMKTDESPYPEVQEILESNSSCYPKIVVTGDW
jgi:hypothetical protein